VIFFYLALILLSFVAAAGITTIYCMLPALYVEYGAGSGPGWTVTSYLLVAAVCSALCGRLGDLSGRRRVALVVLCIACIGAIISACSASLEGLILGCALQGTAASLMPLSMGIARECLEERRVPVAIGIIGAAGTAGAGLAYMVAGIVIDHFAAHGAFWMKATVALIAVAALLAFVPRPRLAPQSLRGINLTRGVLFAPAIAAILIGVEKSRQWGLGDWRVVTGVASGILLLVYWSRFEAREKRPLIDVSLLRNRAVVLANVAVAWVALGCEQNGQVFSLFLQQPVASGAGFGVSTTRLGWTMLGLNSIAVLVSPFSGALSARIGAREVGMLGAVVSALAWVLLAVAHDTLFQTLVAAAFIVAGFSLVLPALYVLVVQSVPEERTSEAAGMTYVVMATAMAVGAQILFGILSGSGFPTERAHVTTFLYIVTMCIACLITLMPLRKRAYA
jgi:MFS family permease